MEYYREMLIVLSPCLILIVLAVFAKVLINSAKRRKGIAVAFGVMAQMLLPDPQVEKTIETIIVAKRNIDERDAEKDNKTRKTKK
jgi:hypothetical protein